MKMPGWFSRENIEWATRLYKYVRGRALTRWGGFLLLGALALYSNVLQLIVVGIFLLLNKQLSASEPPSGVAYAMLALGCILMVLDRILPETTKLPTPYPHDENLMRAIRSTCTPATDSFLRQHDFGASFKADLLDPIDVFQSWSGPQYEFINPEVNTAWMHVRKAARELMREVGEKTVSRGAADWLSPVYDNEDRDFYTPDMRARMNVMNRAATDLVEKWDKFDRLARRQIPNVV